MTKAQGPHPHREFLGEPVKADHPHTQSKGAVAATEEPSGHGRKVSRHTGTEHAPPRAKGDVEHSTLRSRFGAGGKGK
jgi:hypothetical protein